MKLKFKKSISLLLMILITGCAATQEIYSPPTDVERIQPIPENGKYKVTNEDTIHNISVRYDLDYHELAERNHIPFPFKLTTGQILVLGDPVPDDGINRLLKNLGEKTQSLVTPATKEIHTVAVAPKTTPIVSKRAMQVWEKPVVAVKRVPTFKPIPPPIIPAVNPVPTPIVYQSVASQPEKAVHDGLKEMASREPTAAVKRWLWPAAGPILENFSSLNKGINIGGSVGTPILATAPGKVVYMGNGLRDYGNLIIIKHNNDFLTAYAHNSKVLIREGDWVQAGQKIAEMGNTGSKKVMLHFEIRRNSRPINPLRYLAKNSHRASRELMRG
jgi:lipoprotein NlpD